MSPLVETLIFIICFFILVAGVVVFRLIQTSNQKYSFRSESWKVGDYESHKAFLRKHGFDDGKDDETKV